MASKMQFPQTKKISQIADIIQGHQITEEEIYNSYGEIPLFTGKNKIVGYVKTSIVDKSQLPVVSYPTKGQVGDFYIQKEVFEANNTGVLIIKDEWKQYINLVWLISQLSPKIEYHSNSKSGVGYIGKDIMREILITIPKPEEQQAIAEIYSKIVNLENAIEHNLEKLNKVQNGTTLSAGKDMEEELLGNIFEFKGGNSGLTEEFIYNNLATSESEELIKVISGSADDRSVFGHIDEKARMKGKPIKSFSVPAIVVVRKGDAGSMRIIESGKFTINDDAYVMVLRKAFKEKINLYWFIYQYQSFFSSLASSKSDNSTFNKTYAEQQLIKYPALNIQNEIGEQLRTMMGLKNTLLELRSKIIKLKKITSIPI